LASVARPPSLPPVCPPPPPRSALPLPAPPPPPRSPLLPYTTLFRSAFPNAVGEAMACAVPCVVTDLGDSALLLGEGGLLVPPGRSEEHTSELQSRFELVCGLLLETKEAGRHGGSGS